MDKEMSGAILKIPAIDPGPGRDEVFGSVEYAFTVHKVAAKGASGNPEPVVGIFYDQE